MTELTNADFESTAEADVAQTSADATQTSVDTDSADVNENSQSESGKDEFLESLFGDELEYQDNNDYSEMDEKSSQDEDGFDTEDETKDETEEDNNNNDNEEKEPVFKLNYMKEEREFPLSEIKVLAQKGLDYDRIREGYDRYKASENDLKFLQEHKDEVFAAMDLMSTFGKPLDELKDMIVQNNIFQRKQEIMESELISDELAEHIARLEIENGNYLKNKEQADSEHQAEIARQQQEQQEQQSILDDISNLLKIRPELNSADVQLPQEVIKKVQEENIPLSVAYLDWENKQKEIELKQIKQSAISKKKNIGSLQGQKTKETDEDVFLKALFAD